MDEEEFENKQENENSILRDIFEDFIEEEAEEETPKKEVSEELKQLADWVLRQVERLLSMRKAIFFDKISLVKQNHICKSDLFFSFVVLT